MSALDHDFLIAANTAVLDLLQEDAPAHPPSRGAHRLFWWLTPIWSWPPPKNRLAHLREGAGIDAADIVRIMRGTLVPAEEVAIAIAMATEGAVLPEDWDELTTQGWLDRPTPRAD